MEVHCRLELSYESADEADKVLGAVAVDNEGFVQARREGKSIVSEISAVSFLSLLHTVEDYLACVSVAEKALKATDSPRERERPRHSRKRASRRGS